MTGIFTRRALRTRLAAGLAAAALTFSALAADLPDTGISGVYEVMVGTDNRDDTLRYFAEFGFAVVAEGQLNKAEASAKYGVPSALTSVRLQNGSIDTHGLVRMLIWDRPLGPGVGYAPAETVGQQMAVMRTDDIFRLKDVYDDARAAGQKWFMTPPVYDDLYGMSDAAPDFFNRRVGVRESAVYGERFNHVFYQRYGYRIPGYGTVDDASALRTSEFTHHDFVIKGDITEVTRHYSEVLGLKAENDAVLDGDWQRGPRAVFQMGPGVSHWYRGFVSPNNICGKLKFFVPMDIVRDRSSRQRPGELGITLHSFTSPRLSKVHNLATEHGLSPTPIAANEFGEDSFVFVGPDGVAWEIIEAAPTASRPVTEFAIEPTGH